LRDILIGLNRNKAKRYVDHDAAPNIAVAY